MPRLLIPALLILTTTTALAADDPKAAVTDAAQAGDDFRSQGEYSGPGYVGQDGEFVQQKIGLQVVALGGEEFSGMLYMGGLPGSGWDRQERHALTGRREGEQVHLTGDGLDVLVGDRIAKVASAERLLVADLQQVRRESPTLGQEMPADGIAIFDGSPSEYLKNAKVDDDGLLMQGCEINAPARDFTLHIEFRLPYMPYARGQGRANSGVYIHSRYEVQVLDSFGLTGEFNECASLYRYQPPLINMCLPPLTWQTYDILFLAPRFDADGNKVQNARVTVHHNGVPVQRAFEPEHGTGAGQKLGEGPNVLPIKLQDHGNPVRFRNVWMIFHDNASQPQTSPQPQPQSPGERGPQLVPMPPPDVSAA
jgi:hypothetical protein